MCIQEMQIVSTQRLCVLYNAISKWAFTIFLSPHECAQYLHIYNWYSTLSAGRSSKTILHMFLAAYPDLDAEKLFSWHK
jgi:hypothetical protein